MLFHLVLSLNHEQEEPNVGTTSLSQMCKICHSITKRFQLFSFKTIMKCCLLPRGLLSKSKECACNIFLPSVWKETNLMGLQIEENLGKSKRHFFALWKELRSAVQRYSSSLEECLWLSALRNGQLLREEGLRLLNLHSTINFGISFEAWHLEFQHLHPGVLN